MIGFCFLGLLLSDITTVSTVTSLSLSHLEDSRAPCQNAWQYYWVGGREVESTWHIPVVFFFSRETSHYCCQSIIGAWDGLREKNNIFVRFKPKVYEGYMSSSVGEAGEENAIRLTDLHCISIFY